MKKINEPGYKDFREALDALYPEHKGRIALNNHVRHNNADLIEQDLKDQISPDILDKIPESVMTSWAAYLKMRAKRGHVVGEHFTDVTYQMVPPPPPDKEGETPKTPEEKTVTEMSGSREAYLMYIAMDDRPANPRRYFHRTSSCEIESYRMKFNKAAMEPAMAKWFTFYHELAHAVMRLGIHDYPRKTAKTMDDVMYYTHLEESVCDAFATLHLLKDKGDRALPFLRTYADMRLSRFHQHGHSYFTGGAIHDLIGKYEDNTLGDAFDNNKTLYQAAFKIARDNFVTRQAFDETYKYIDNLTLNRIGTLRGAFMRALARSKIGENYGLSNKDPAALSDDEKRMRNAYNRSANVLRKDYDTDIIAGSKGFIDRTVKKSLYALGLGKDPGF